MAIWALADLHLALGVPDKAMDFFGEPWIGYTDKIRKHWKEKISTDDLVLIAGDISWAMRPEEAVPDFEWIHQLPGTKVMIRGNHDYWWTSLSKVEKVLPPSMHLIQNNAFHWQDVSIAGARLWDTSEYQFGKFINYQTNPRAKTLVAQETDLSETERIFLRELARLEMSLKCLKKDAKRRIVMTHYAPISADLQDSRASKLLEKYQIDTCVFGHLHNVRQSESLFGEKNGIRYLLTSCDYLNFVPINID
jgi:predicted phosphohydrolase